MWGVVDSTGEVVLTPDVKAWMRRELPQNPSNEAVYAWAEQLGKEAESSPDNPGICGHCVANYLIDVFDRYQRIYGRAAL
jgi:hypothetical protein